MKSSGAMSDGEIRDLLRGIRYFFKRAPKLVAAKRNRPHGSTSRVNLWDGDLVNDERDADEGDNESDGGEGVVVGSNNQKNAPREVHVDVLCPRGTRDHVQLTERRCAFETRDSDKWQESSEYSGMVGVERGRFLADTSDRSQSQERVVGMGDDMQSLADDGAHSLTSATSEYDSNSVSQADGTEATRSDEVREDEQAVGEMSFNVSGHDELGNLADAVVLNTEFLSPTKLQDWQRSQSSVNPHSQSAINPNSLQSTSATTSEVSDERLRMSIKQVIPGGVGQAGSELLALVQSPDFLNRVRSQLFAPGQPSAGETTPPNTTSPTASFSPGMFLNRPDASVGSSHPNRVQNSSGLRESPGSLQ